MSARKIDKSIDAAAPRVLTANRLRDGAIVYRRADGGFTERLADAAVIDPAGVEAALAALQPDLAAARIVAPYAIPVRIGPDGTIAPIQYREQIRAAGPTIDYRPTLVSEAAQ